ncbi:MAG: prolipoprotein diacylglyceryl transferase [Alphaproteobacteria bacterium]|nr:prolipoprotein diacylglyceryl transferase [Alphaproteobacteria bacterium]
MTDFDFPAIDPVAFSLGPLHVRWYALAYIAGFLIGWRWALRLTRLYPGQPDRAAIDDLLSWVMLGVILGGRLGYVLFYKPVHFLHNPHEILMIWQGGMSFHGGALGVILAMAAFAHFKKIPFLRIADIVTACVPVGLFFGRIANFINGELFGRVTDAPWGMRFPGGGDLARHPSQFYEAALEGLVLFFILNIMIRRAEIRMREGFIAGSFLLFYGLFRALVEIVREPDAHLGYLWGVVSMGQMLSLPMMIAGIGVMIYARSRSTA